jgi:hypothetical protein
MQEIQEAVNKAWNDVKKGLDIDRDYEAPFIAATEKQGDDFDYADAWRQLGATYRGSRETVGRFGGIDAAETRVMTVEPRGFIVNMGVAIRPKLAENKELLGISLRHEAVRNWLQALSPFSYITLSNLATPFQQTFYKFTEEVMADALEVKLVGYEEAIDNSPYLCKYVHEGTHSNTELVREAMSMFLNVLEKVDWQNDLPAAIKGLVEAGVAKYGGSGNTTVASALINPRDDINLMRMVYTKIFRKTADGKIKEHKYE